MLIRPIRLGMVGSGDISGRFFEQAALLEQVSFVAVASKHLNNAEKKAKEYQVPHWYDDYREMMKQEELDGVVVTTPHSVHAEVVIAALEQGLHVLNEKPMATSYSDCQKMVELSESNGLIFMNLPYDFNPNMVQAVSYLKESYIGKITGAEAQLSLPGPHRDNWYYDLNISHGGAVLDCMVYPISRLIALLGPAKYVMAGVNTLIPQRIVGNGIRIKSNVDDNATIIVEFQGGQHAVIRTLWGASFVQNNTIIYGRKGTLALNDSGYDFVIHSPENVIPDAEQVTWRGVKGCYTPEKPQAFAVDQSIVGHFVNCLRTGQPPYASVRQQLHVHEIMFGAYESARKGERFQLESTFDPRNPELTKLFDTKSNYI